MEIKQPTRRGGARPGAGRKPVPTAIKRVKGTLQPSRTNASEPRPARGLGEPPTYMSDDAKDAWRYAVENAPAGLLCALDAAVLERWANCASLYRSALAKIHQAGIAAMLVKTPGGVLRRSPLMEVVRDLAGEMRGYESDMGFTPAARVRVSSSAGPVQQPNDPWAEIAG